MRRNGTERERKKKKFDKYGQRRKMTTQLATLIRKGRRKSKKKKFVR